MNPSSNSLSRSADSLALSTSFIELFYHWEKVKADEVYLRQPQNGKWTDYTWKEVGNQARRMATALKSMGLPPQSNIAMISKNCAHWIICDMAIKMSGHVSVPFYPNLTPDQLRQLMDHSGSKVLFVGKLDDLEVVETGVPNGVRMISFPISPAKRVEKWDDIVARHEPQTENYIPPTDDLETIIYTSGTTGEPKGVMITHGINAAVIEPILSFTQINQIEGRFFSYLPLNHVAERALVEGGSLMNGGVIYFAESVDTFADNLREARPTIFLAVPRIWTKFQMGILEKLPQEKLDRLLRIPIISRLIKRKIKKGLGLDKAIWLVSGAAPIAYTTVEWFKQLDIHISEAYGMTENNAVCSVNHKDNIRIGTVGQIYPGCEVKIIPETSEIIMKAPWNMKGYFKNPSMTDAILKDGWLYTGDMGEIENGFLKITGRVKDMFKTAKGEYIIPVPMERMFSSNTLIEQVCIVGYGLPQPFALVNLSEYSRHIEKAEVEESLTQTLHAVNNSVTDYEKVNRVVVTADTWTVENGLLTPTLKVRRNVMDARYKVRMEEWYNQGGEVVIWE
ncbi:MAG: AMP-binding protein [Bacteroidia bacterium]|nr:AMP-binding protein [Bacteroidia bacterium]